ncbi:hypothetical protein [Aporhodopirellula aestuarii]|uniref:Uncharacterized protein n=1 Tax=Aporhodopirellula aestuarii TaxID=2950107 RepID=A0ABT0U2P5_9BACT|nr:hypothetical protein [Aporhodopirellula aestuarii]MCM2371073.1 hypothetical protein [Aporhodopirellula aestuarii]
MPPSEAFQQIVMFDLSSIFIPPFNLLAKVALSQFADYIRRTQYPDATDNEIAILSIASLLSEIDGIERLTDEQREQSVRSFCRKIVEKNHLESKDPIKPWRLDWLTREALTNWRLKEQSASKARWDRSFRILVLRVADEFATHCKCLYTDGCFDIRRLCVLVVATEEEVAMLTDAAPQVDETD